MTTGAYGKLDKLSVGFHDATVLYVSSGNGRVEREETKDP